MNRLLPLLLLATAAFARNLTLDDVVAMAVRDNLDIRIERTNVSSAQQAEAGAHGFYDPTIRATGLFQVLNTPSPSILSGRDGRSSEHDLTGSFAIRQRAWQGTLFDLSFDAARTTTNNPFIGLNPYYPSTLKFAITQPLLRGRTIDADRALLRIRSVQTGIARTELELRVIDTVTRVELAYWDLVAARDSAEVNREAVELARTQLEQNRRRIAAGSLAAIELSASEAELERRLDRWYASQDTITRTENTLKTLVAPRREDPIWDTELVPTEAPALLPPSAASLPSAIAGALKSRPELRDLSQQQNANSIEQRQNADQLRPALNLVASYSNAGIGGTDRDATDPLVAGITRFFGAAPLSTGNRYHSVQSGLNFEWTARNRQARANLEQSAIASRKLELLRTRAEQAIEAEVRNALKALETARQRITAAETSAKAAKEKLDSEQRLFASGESTNFLVLTRQNEYSDARQRLLAARLDFNKAVATFEEATGETLATRKLTID